MTSSPDHSELRRLAEAATPGTAVHITPRAILEVLDENERLAAEIAVLLKGAEWTNKHLEEAVDERIQELGIETDVFDKECISAVRWLLKNKCGDAGTELLDDLDGWSVDAAVAVISEEIDRVEAAEASRDAALERLAEAERLLEQIRRAYDHTHLQISSPDICGDEVNGVEQPPHQWHEEWFGYVRSFLQGAKT